MSMTNADKALQLLMEGNGRFVSGSARGPNRTITRARDVSRAQSPFAAVLGCSDSRESMDIIFDCGIGDLFVVRIAGNVVSDMVMGSLEFSVLKLGVSLIMVMGHTNCGAVQAAMDSGEVPGHMGSLMKEIEPCVNLCRRNPDITPDEVSRENVKNSVTRLRSAGPILEEKCMDGSLLIVGGIHDLYSGTVDLLIQ